MKVLIVDDNEKVRLLVRHHLPACVIDVYQCADGCDALAAYRCCQPDWVLMDWEMPRLNGIAATRQIIAEFPAAKICMITVFDEAEIRRDAFKAGAREFVLKDRLDVLESILLERM